MTTEQPHNLEQGADLPKPQDGNLSYEQLLKNVEKLAKGDNQARDEATKLGEKGATLNAPSFAQVKNAPEGSAQEKLNQQATILNSNVRNLISTRSTSETINSGNQFTTVESKGISVQLTSQTLQALKNAANLDDATQFLLKNTTVGSEVNAKLRKDSKYSSIKNFSEFNQAVQTDTLAILKDYARQVSTGDKTENIPSSPPESTVSQENVSNIAPEQENLSAAVTDAKETVVQDKPLEEKQPVTPELTSRPETAAVSLDTSNNSIKALTESTLAAKKTLDTFQPKSLRDLKDNVGRIQIELQDLIRKLENALPATGSTKEEFTQHLKALNEINDTIERKKDLFTNPIAQDLMDSSLAILRTNFMTKGQMQTFDNLLQNGKETVNQLDTLLKSVPTTRSKEQVQTPRTKQRREENTLNTQEETRSTPAPVIQDSNEKAQEVSKDIQSTVSNMVTIAEKKPSTIKDGVGITAELLESAKQLYKMLDSSESQNDLVRNAIISLKTFIQDAGSTVKIFSNPNSGQVQFSTVSYTEALSRDYTDEAFIIAQNDLSRKNRLLGVLHQLQQNPTNGTETQTRESSPGEQTPIQAKQEQNNTPVSSGEQKDVLTQNNTMLDIKTLTVESISALSEKQLVQAAKQIMETKFQDTNTLSDVAEVAPLLVAGLRTLIERITGGQNQEAKNTLPDLQKLNDYLVSKEPQLGIIRGFPGNMGPQKLSEFMDPNSPYGALVGPMAEMRDLGQAILLKLERTIQ